MESVKRKTYDRSWKDKSHKKKPRRDELTESDGCDDEDSEVNLKFKLGELIKSTICIFERNQLDEVIHAEVLIAIFQAGGTDPRSLNILATVRKLRSPQEKTVVNEVSDANGEPVQEETDPAIVETEPNTSDVSSPETVADFNRREYGSYGKKGKKVWLELVEYTNDAFTTRCPSEDQLLRYFAYLRDGRRMASSSLWVYYSLLNSVVKHKYGVRLQTYPSISALLKKFDAKQRPAQRPHVFESLHVRRFIEHPYNSPYWLVRKVIIILAHFAGLRHAELMELRTDKIKSRDDGIVISHSRARHGAGTGSGADPPAESKILIPRTGPVNYAAVVDEYLKQIKAAFGDAADGRRRVLVQATSTTYVNQPMGKNKLSKVPSEMATVLGVDKPGAYTFYSLRKSTSPLILGESSILQFMTASMTEGSSPEPAESPEPPDSPESSDPVDITESPVKEDEESESEEGESMRLHIKEEDAEVRVKQELEDSPMLTVNLNQSFHIKEEVDDELPEEEEEELEEDPLGEIELEEEPVLEPVSLDQLEREFVLDDSACLTAIKEKSRPQYSKAWANFRAFFDNSADFDARVPSEAELMDYFRHLRTEKLFSSSSMWTTYSMVNSVVKEKYGASLRQYEHLRDLIRSYDVDVKRKAQVFTMEDIQAFLGRAELSEPYWMVRKTIITLAFFGGLRHGEIMGLKLENFRSSKDGVHVVHDRCRKQGADNMQRESKFLVPRIATGRVDYADIVESYVERVHRNLGKVQGRAFWTGRKDTFVNQPVGKNSIAYIPQEMAKLLGKENVTKYTYTFNSLRYSLASAAADNGAVAYQMANFPGWNESLVSE